MAVEQPELAGAAGPPPAQAEPSFDLVRRGYSPDQVREHLKRGEERMRELEARLARAVGELADARQSVESAATARRDPLEGVSQHVVDLVRGFDEEIERQRRMADLEATGLLAEARTEAARMRMDAQSVADQSRGQAERMLAEAREEAARIREQVETLRASTMSDVRELRDRMRASLRELDAAVPDEPGQPRVIVLEEPVGKVPPAPQPSAPPSSDPSPGASGDPS